MGRAQLGGLSTPHPSTRSTLSTAEVHPVQRCNKFSIELEREMGVMLLRHLALLATIAAAEAATTTDTSEDAALLQTLAKLAPDLADAHTTVVRSPCTPPDTPLLSSRYRRRASCSAMLLTLSHGQAVAVRALLDTQLQANPNELHESHCSSSSLVALHPGLLPLSQRLLHSGMPSTNSEPVSTPRLSSISRWC
jgi:hypothetical protein